MKIAFWNMQRLGKDSAKREEAIRCLLNTQKPDWLFLCEVMSSHDDAQSNSSNPYTLNYACYNSAGKSCTMTFTDPTATDGWKKAGYKGGSDFEKIAPRGLSFLRVVDPDTGEVVCLYMTHGPASNNAEKVATFIACYLDELHADDPWLLIGDLNVEPHKLAQAEVGIDLDDLISAPSSATHKKGKTLDYVLTNIQNVEVKTVRRSQRLTGSDHSPIIAEF